jgi:hypothetical protein
MLHFIYRSCGSENQKGRPPYFSKLLALVSFLCAFAEVERRFLAAAKSPPELIYLNDGPIPANRAKIMERTGEIVTGENLGLRGSLRAALALPAVRRWDPNDLVWFAEDDYLYVQRAFTGLVTAAERFPDADYFGLYALLGRRTPDGKPLPDYAPVPVDWRDSDPVLVEDHPWRRAVSTTHTFGARVGAIVADKRLWEVAIWSDGAFDHTSCLMYQGYQPFSWRSLGGEDGRLKTRVRRAAIRAGLNLWQAMRVRLGAPARTLVAPEPSLSTHLEAEHLAIGTDWAKVAREQMRWGSGSGLLDTTQDAPDPDQRSIFAAGG